MAISVTWPAHFAATTFQTNSVAAAGKIETCHHHLQVPKVVVYVYPTPGLMQANKILKMKFCRLLVNRENHENYIPYGSKVVQGKCLANLLFLSVWQKKVWWMYRSAKGLLIVNTTLDGFSFMNHRQFTKVTKLSTHQTFLLYDTSLKNLYMHDMLFLLLQTSAKI